MTLREEQPPDISLSGLKLWVHGWQYPDQTEYWDANWVTCTAKCEAHGATVKVNGSFLHVPELLSWLQDSEKLFSTLSGNASLTPMEPDIQVAIQAKSLGHMSIIVDITPDNINQRHHFEFEADQTHVGNLIQQLRVLLSKYPVRGSAT